MADVRLIDANKLKKILYNIANTMQDSGFSSYAGALGEAANIVDNRPTIDAVPVVRCRECKYSVNIFHKYFVGCDMWKQSTPTDGFCHMGAKMDGGAEG